MYYFVSEEDDQECAESNDKNAGESWDVIVDCVYKLCAYDDVGRSPANAG